MELCPYGEPLNPTPLMQHVPSVISPLKGSFLPPVSFNQEHSTAGTVDRLLTSPNLEHFRTLQHQSTDASHGRQYRKISTTDPPSYTPQLAHVSTGRGKNAQSNQRVHQTNNASSSSQPYSNNPTFTHQPATSASASGGTGGGGLPPNQPPQPPPSHHSQHGFTRTNMDSVTITATDAASGQPLRLTYSDVKPIGNGSFGYVYEGTVQDVQYIDDSAVQPNPSTSTTAGPPNGPSSQSSSAHPSPSPPHGPLIYVGERVAIKKVLQDKRFKNRELQIMRMMRHPNIVQLKAFFYSNGDKPTKDDVYLNLVIEFIPETIYKSSRSYTRAKQYMPFLLIKLYMYQLFRSLAYIHSLGICHRDIKPQNLLLNPLTGVLKLCDFGSAKVLVSGEPNVAYICSRYYRAPELIFGSTQYTTHIDLWSTGCVMAELMIGQPLFPGESGVDQLVEIIKILGTPTREQIRAMNQNYTEHRFPIINSHPWSRVFRVRQSTPPEGLDLIGRLLNYTPGERISAIEAVTHPFFDDLRVPETKLGNGRELPPLFDFTPRELSIRHELNRRLIPRHAEPDLAARGVDLDKYLYQSGGPSSRDRQMDGL